MRGRLLIGGGANIRPLPTEPSEICYESLIGKQRFGAATFLDFGAFFAKPFRSRWVFYYEVVAQFGKAFGFYLILLRGDLSEVRVGFIFVVVVGFLI